MLTVAILSFTLFHTFESIGIAYTYTRGVVIHFDQDKYENQVIMNIVIYYKSIMVYPIFIITCRLLDKVLAETSITQILVSIGANAYIFVST